MDINGPQAASAKGAVPQGASRPGNEKKELAWAFLGLILWSAVVIGGIFGLGYVLGHAIFHW